MAIADDFQVAANGDIRYTGVSDNYTVIEFHRWLGDLMDDAQASGNDILDITDATASDRATDNLITLNSPYNIDDTAAQHLYDGSIVQTNGDEIYDGILVFAPAGTPLHILQAGTAAYPNFWNTGINADATNGISHRFMLKVRTAAADIDNRRLIGMTRDVGFTYTEFNINSTARGNNVIALSYATDLNNATVEATIRTWTDVVNTTEGYVALDVDGDAATEPYYSEWDRASRTINQFYERHKWLTRQSTVESSSYDTDTGGAFQLGNATIIGQSQSFANGTSNQFATRVRVNLRKFGLPTGDITAVLYAHSGTFGTSSIPTGAALATSNAYDASILTTTYVEYEFAFTTPYEMVASTQYVVAIEHAVIDGSNYIEVDGLASSGSHAGNRAQNVAATWTPTAGDDLAFEIYASPETYGIPGEIFRGVTHEVALSTGSGTWGTPEFEEVTWSGGTGRLYAVDDKTGTSTTKMWIQLLTGAAPTNTQVITGTTSGATGTASGTATVRPISAPPVGASTGSAIIGAYGLGIQTTDLTAADKLTDLDNILQEPPNNVTFSVGGLLATEDYVLVAPLGYSFAWDTEGGTPPFVVGETINFTTPTGTGYLSYFRDDGTSGRMQIRLLTGDIPINNSGMTGVTSGATGLVNGAVVPSEDPRQLTLNTTLSAAAETALVTNATIPTDTPTAGTVRVQLDNNVYRTLPYDSYTSATFTLGTAVTTAQQIDVVAAAGTFTRAAGDFIADGFVAGMRFTGSQFTNGGNNAAFTIASVTTTVVTVVNNAGMVNESGGVDEIMTSNGHDFTVTNATGGATEATANSVFISYIDKLATTTPETFAGVYDVDRPLFIRVRDGGVGKNDTPIKTFETTGTLGSAGGSATAIRTSDL